MFAWISRDGANVLRRPPQRLSSALRAFPQLPLRLCWLPERVVHMAKITISYRRDDSMDITGRIFDRLTSRYGRETVFRDIDSIPPGWIFANTFRQALR